MLRPGFLTLACLLLLAGVAAAVIGVFEGELLAPPQAGWLYVRGANGFLRRVEIGDARIVYASSVPPQARSGPAAEHLRKGTRVRITAQPRDDGEWRARQIEVLRFPPSSSRTQLSPPSPNPTFNSARNRPSPAINVRFVATPAGPERLIHQGLPTLIANN